MDDMTEERDRCLSIIRGTLHILEETRRPGVRVDAENVLKVLIGTIAQGVPADVYITTYREALDKQLAAAGLL